MNRNKVFFEQSLVAAQADETVGAEILCACMTREHTAYVEYPAGTSAGNVVVETAPYKGYTGVWAEIGQLPWSAAGKMEAYRFTGVFGALRLRVEAVIVGGAVNGWIGAN
jgi:hypothetical protein